MKRLFVCCDGTWNAPTDLKDGVPVPTNVVKFYNALAERDNGDEQLCYYHPGVGADETSLLARVWAGVTGNGLIRNIKSAYYWLAQNFSLGDDIYLLGFSRGAFTARSLSGLVSSCGLIREAQWNLVDEAFRMYRLDPQKSDTKAEREKFKQAHCHSSLFIRFLGVWDTVGALGIPPDLMWWSKVPGLRLLGRRLEQRLIPRFHNTQLSPIVKNASHALALDEMRRTFSPTLWTGQAATGQDVAQMWFTGVHADVGGGYQEIGLSDIALRWMIDRASRCGASFRQQMLEQIHGDPNAVLHNSLQGVFQTALTQVRGLPDLDNYRGSGPTGEQVHYSVQYRRGLPPIFQAPYKKSPELIRKGKIVECSDLKVGEQAEVTVYAKEKWNWTGIYFEKGATYELWASGAWLNGKDKYTPDGYEDRGGCLRFPKALFFCLIGAVVDFANPDVHGEIQAPRLFAIGLSTTFSLGNIEGYFYAFANDSENGYADNRGSVTLTVKRIR